MTFNKKYFPYKINAFVILWHKDQLPNSEKKNTLFKFHILPLLNQMSFQFLLQICTNVFWRYHTQVYQRMELHTFLKKVFRKKNLIIYVFNSYPYIFHFSLSRKIILSLTSVKRSMYRSSVIYRRQMHSQKIDLVKR